MVLEEMVGIQPQAPFVGIITDAHHPAAEHVAGNIPVNVLVGFGTSGYKNIPIILQACAPMKHFHAALAIRTIHGPAEERGHLEAHLYHYRKALRRVSYAQIACLAMVTHIVGIFFLT